MHTQHCCLALRCLLKHSSLLVAFYFLHGSPSPCNLQNKLPLLRMLNSNIIRSVAFHCHVHVRIADKQQIETTCTYMYMYIINYVHYMYTVRQLHQALHSIYTCTCMYTYLHIGCVVGEHKVIDLTIDLHCTERCYV